MVWCDHCGKNVLGTRPYDGALACNLCGRILEIFNFSTQVTFVKNTAGDKIRTDEVEKMRRREEDSEKRVEIVEKEEMVWCDHCEKKVLGTRPYDSALTCNLCGRILEIFNFSTEVENAARHSQASSNIVRRSVQSGNPSSRERRIKLAREEFNLTNDVNDTELDWVFVNEEAKNVPPPATTVEAVRITFANLLKRLGSLVNYDVLEELFDTPSVDESPKKSKAETGMEEKNE